MYTESLFLALTLLTFITFERRRFHVAAAAAAMAALTRPTGIVLAPCLAAQLVQRREWAWRAWLPVASNLAGLGGFAAYQLVRFGTPFAYIRTQATPPTSHSLSQALADITLQGRPGISSVYLGAMLVIALLFLSAVPRVYRRLGSAYALFVGLSVLLPASSGLVSLERYVAVAFPAFVVLASTQSRLRIVGIVTVCVYAQLLFSALFVAGYAIY